MPIPSWYSGEKRPDVIAVQFAVDKSVRQPDSNGFLHVKLTNISKANVCPYYGKEIPNGEALGLQPDKIYMMWRHPEELAKAAASLNNLPLMDDHIIVSADAPEKDKIAGTMGSEAFFDGTYLKNSMAVWVRSSIDRIESKMQKELSAAYQYLADMTPGETKGLRYDGIMRNIKFNHVALVREGRAGPDVMVADGKLGSLSMKFHPVKAKLAAKFACDTALSTADRGYLMMALDEMETEVEAEDGEPDEAEAEAEARDRAKDKKAKDAKKARDAKKAKDKAAKDKAAKDAESDDDTAEDEEPDDKAAKDKAARDKAAKDQKAMDSAVSTAVATAVKQTEERLEAISVAKTEVAPIVGAVSGLDSADAIYRFALDSAQIEHKDITELTALRQMVKMMPKPGDLQQQVIASDSKTVSGVVDLFPRLARYA